MAYSIDECSGMVTFKKGEELIFGCSQPGRLHYQFFQKGDEDWVVFGSDESYGFRFLNLVDKHAHYYPKNQLRYAVQGLLVNPTGEYMMYINGITVCI